MNKICWMSFILRENPLYCMQDKCSLWNEEDKCCSLKTHLLFEPDTETYEKNNVTDVGIT